MKYIKQWIRKYNKPYYKSDRWKEVVQQREEKKTLLHESVVEVEEFEQSPVVSTAYGQTIFHRDDLGHNQEEANKIQKLYQDLGNLPLSPRFAV